jgi:hypothetical protein
MQMKSPGNSQFPGLFALLNIFFVLMLPAIQAERQPKLPEHFN